MTLSVEEARELVLNRCRVLEAENVALLESLGGVLAEDVRSDIDVAPFDNSAMDGYAVHAADLRAATEDAPITLNVISHIAAGDYSELAVERGQAARIMTGAPVPPGADAVVMVEFTIPGKAEGTTGGTVHITRPVTEGENIRRRAEEVAAGDVVLAAGEVIGPAAVGLLASAGHATARIHRRPRVAVLSTGDELVEVTEVPGPGKIRNSNSYSISAQVIAAGGIPVRYPILRDDREATRKAFVRAAVETDFIVTSGGVSVGDFDFVKPVLEELGEMEFCKVAMRPGNPQTLGSIQGVPFFGLPGNPTSTFVGFEIFVRPALRYMQGHTCLDRPRQTAILAHDVKKRQDRRYFLRARIERLADGTLSVSLSGSQSSALLTAAHHGNCLLVLPEGVGAFPAGSTVEVIRLDMEEVIV
ncbi:MAG: molybdopterin molybdotransferase MoeA [Coriobacteriia bacterium]|nr:molybdopterin molybdotransferase MoeA [Coriobacteriia bacterium]